MSSMGINDSEDSVFHQLNELFGNVLTVDVIKSVAVSCKYDVLESSNKLLEMSNDREKRKHVEDIAMNDQTFSWRSALLNAGTTSVHLNSCSQISPKKSKKCLHFESAVNNINKGFKVLVIMRGMPGSGKSTLAKKILEHTVGFDANYHLHILSTDDYFYLNNQGQYHFDFRKLDEAHNWNQRRAFQAMSRGFSPVIVDNTNVEMWEMKPYATMAIDYGYILEIIEPQTHWCFNDRELAKRNVHGVARVKIKDMIERYEKHLTPQKLLSAYQLTYKFQKPPQLRLYPPLDINVSETQNIKGNVIKSTSMSVLRQRPEKQNQCLDTINLMDFDDDDNDALSTKSEPLERTFNGGINSLWSQHGIDNILMHNDKSETNNVLKPITNIEQETVLLISDDEDEPPKENNLYSQIEQAWGVKESALKSWDIVTPLNKEYVGNLGTKHLPRTTKDINIETTESSCCTEDEYFRLLNNDKLVPGFYGGLKVVDTVNRDINYSTPKREQPILLKLMLDKGCMTDDVYEDYETHISELESLFPTIPKTHLIYWYNKCKGDLEWTIDFLLEGKEEIISLIEPEDLEDTLITNTSKQSNNSGTCDEISEICSSPNNDANPNTSKISKRKMKKSGSASSEDKDEIRKILESKIDISGEHYSKHLLRVKNFKTKADTAVPCTSRSSLGQVNNNNELLNVKSVQPQSSVDDVISIDSDFEFDDTEGDNFDEKDLFEQTVELNLGEFFVTQLEEKFADPNIMYPKGFQPVVQMPITLAKQLYSFYIESVYQQMENQQFVLESLLKEDEEFARQLQAKEEESSDANHMDHIPSFKEIQEGQQAAKKAHQREVEKWKYLNPDTLAAKLTKQKLYSTFPTVPQDILVEILQAHDNKYVDTVETLLASAKLGDIQGPIDMIREPPIRDEILQEMKEAQQNSSCENSEERQEARYYREEANKYLKKRTELRQQAQQYYQRGMTEVAQFYSGLASLQTTYYDRANGMAATTFLDEHSQRLQDFNTLDLHFLYVKEAIPALDVFLDRNINLLKHSTSKQSENLQIITGRGNRSENGISKIKPVVISRLRKRNIKFAVLNPGLLKVKITKNSLVTSEMMAL